MKKEKVMLVLLILAGYLAYFIYDMGINDNETGFKENESVIPFENVAIPEVYFCPQDNCSAKMLEFISFQIRLLLGLFFSLCLCILVLVFLQILRFRYRVCVQAVLFLCHFFLLFCPLVGFLIVL